MQTDILWYIMYYGILYIMIYYGLDKGKKRNAFRIIVEVETEESVEM